MSERDPITGLPKELDVWETIAKEEQRIRIRKEKKRFGKIVTIIDGIKDPKINLKELAKKLKNKLACGGTSKEGMIELQGDHVKKVKEELVALGFNRNSIS